MGIATLLQPSSAPRVDGAWALKVSSTSCFQPRLEKCWVVIRAVRHVILHCSWCEPPAFQAGIYREEHIFVSGVCVKFELLTITIVLTLVESWYILSLRHFFQHWVLLSNYIFLKKRLNLFIWICHLWLLLYVLAFFWESERMDLLLFTISFSRKLYHVQC